MAKAKTEPKVTLEREYIIPLRREWLKVPEYKRVNKAVKAIKQFIVKHMKIYDRDLKKVKVDIILNNELRFRGMRKPPAKVKVKVRKYDNDIVKVELAEIPKVIKYKLDREKRKKEEKARKEEKKKVEEKPEEKKEEKPKEEEKEIKEKEEKREAVKEAGLKEAKKEHREMKHEVKVQKVKRPQIRKALEK